MCHARGASTLGYKILRRYRERHACVCVIFLSRLTINWYVCSMYGRTQIKIRHILVLLTRVILLECPNKRSSSAAVKYRHKLYHYSSRYCLLLQARSQYCVACCFVLLCGYSILFKQLFRPVDSVYSEYST